VGAQQAGYGGARLEGDRVIYIAAGLFVLGSALVAALLLFVWVSHLIE
jgi:hypothetical protein